jgi:hypothetical protein
MHIFCRSLLIVAFVTCSLGGGAQGFDWKLLDGNWAESTDHQYGCLAQNLHQRFELSADKKTLKFKNDRIWKIGASAEIREYSAVVVKAQDKSLFIKYAAELQDIPPEYREWEMRFIGPGTYRWRALHWAPNEFNNVIGVKCNQ